MCLSGMSVKVPVETANAAVVVVNGEAAAAVAAMAEEAPGAAEVNGEASEESRVNGTHENEDVDMDSAAEAMADADKKPAVEKPVEKMEAEELPKKKVLPKTPFKDGDSSFSVCELELLAELDSRAFGYLRLKADRHERKRKTVLKAVAFIEQTIASRAMAKRPNQDTLNNNGKVSSALPPSVEPKTYAKLGHLHLLLENYSLALSAYQKYASNASSKDAVYKDCAYLYGLGLTFFNFNAYGWATRLFRQALFFEPGFLRANEIHVRLGLMSKVNNDFSSALKHFTVALEAEGPCTFSKAEIRFHVAHLHEVYSKYQKAVTLYKELLDNPPSSTPNLGDEYEDEDSLKAKKAKEEEAMLMEVSEELRPSIRGDVHRQLGWIHYSVDSLGGTDKPTRIHTAIQHLQKSLEVDPKSGQSLYLLGRCYASVGKVHEAFVAYRNSVDKSESNADTWCSIGVLYQQQNQPMDALQAYICAVQLEKHHSAAWTNLGILYESVNQLQDSLACYVNAISRVKHPSHTMNQRIKYLKTQLASAPPNTGPASGGKTKLPSVEEGWNLPVQSEMAGRQSSASQAKAKQRQQQQQQQEIQQPPQQQVPKPPMMSPQQLQTLQYLQSQPHLNPQQHHLLQQLQMQFHNVRQYQLKQQQQAQQQQLAQQHQQQQQQLQQQSGMFNGGGEGPSGAGANNSNNPSSSSGDNLLNNLENKDLSSMSDKDLEALISSQDIGSFAESLLKQIQGDENLDIDALKNEEPMDIDNKDDIKLLGEEESTVKFDALEIPTNLDTVRRKRSARVDASFTCEEIAKACRRAVECDPNIDVPLALRDKGPPEPPTRPDKKLTKENLLPPTPSVHLENKRDAMSPELQDFCYKHPITVVRGIGNALKLDLGLFSTKTLVETNKDHQVAIVTQLKQNADENWDFNLTKQVWHCIVTKSNSTVAKYAQYQSATFQESLKEEQDKGGFRADLDLDGREETRRRRRQQSFLQFGHNVDISDQSSWRLQLTELLKLPSWIRVASAGNMLSHVGYHIQGVNSVQLQMKVPCARTYGRQEVNNVCAIDINIGPGECEWFVIPQEFWGTVQRLCEKHGVNYYHDSWWPNMKDLMDEEIPVYRFMQKPGDMVWISSGCLYWAQSVGWSNNIRWNVAPLTSSQYNLSIERYEWNKYQGIKSIIPMVHLTWQIARNIKVADESLFKVVKLYLAQSLRRFCLISEVVRNALKLETKYQRRKINERVRVCAKCENEVFGILFIRGEVDEDKKPQPPPKVKTEVKTEEPPPSAEPKPEENKDQTKDQEKPKEDVKEPEKPDVKPPPVKVEEEEDELEPRHVVYCFHCARARKRDLSGFVVLEEYRLSDLMPVYDNFRIQPPQGSAASSAATSAVAAQAASAAHQSSHSSTADYLRRQQEAAALQAQALAAQAQQAATAAAAHHTSSSSRDYSSYLTQYAQQAARNSGGSGSSRSTAASESEQMAALLAAYSAAGSATSSSSRSSRDQQDSSTQQQMAALLAAGAFGNNQFMGMNAAAAMAAYQQNPAAFEQTLAAAMSANLSSS